MPGVGRPANEQKVNLAQGVGHTIQPLLGCAGHQLNPRPVALNVRWASRSVSRGPWPAGRASNRSKAVKWISWAGWNWAASPIIASDRERGPIPISTIRHGR